jgi:hypothetical protein
MILRIDRTVQTAQGQAVAGALMYFLTQPANVENLTPLANVYSDLSGTPAPNPQVTDGLGQVGCYLDNAQLYTIVVISPFLKTQVYPDQNLGNSPSSTTVFGEVPTGTIDGVNRKFVLSVVPRLLFFQYNSAVLAKDIGYTINVNEVTLAVAPQVGDTVYASGIA